MQIRKLIIAEEYWTCNPYTRGDEVFFGKRETQSVKKTKYTEKLQVFENDEWKDIPEEVIRIKAPDKNPDEQKFEEECNKAMQTPEFKENMNKLIKDLNKEFKK